MKIALTDKLLHKHLKDEKYLNCSNEGEAVAIAAGYWMATVKRADVFFSADGFCNAFNFITSWIMPDEIEMNLHISIGREEPSHVVMTKLLPFLLDILGHDEELLTTNLIWK